MRGHHDQDCQKTHKRHYYRRRRVCAVIRLYVPFVATPPGGRQRAGFTAQPAVYIAGSRHGAIVDIETGIPCRFLP